jgi:hypothetical protein
MDRVGNILSSSTSIVACVSIAAGTCLPSRRQEAALVYLLISLLLQDNGSTRYNVSKSRHPNTGQNGSKNTANTPFQKVAKLIHSGPTLDKLKLHS